MLLKKRKYMSTISSKMSKVTCTHRFENVRLSASIIVVLYTMRVVGLFEKLDTLFEPGGDPSFGLLAQLVERFAGSEEVAGSNPV